MQAELSNQRTGRLRYGIAILTAALLLPGCGVTNKLASGLNSAVLNHDDPQLVADALPSFLIGLDGAIAAEPGDAQRLLAGAQLYGAYAGSFVDDDARKQRLAQRAFDYGERALCLQAPKICAARKQSFDDFETAVATAKVADVPVLHGFGAAWAGWIQANSGDWNAIADLPKLTALMQRVVALDETWDRGSAHMYLGVLACQRPASLGGEPEKGREHFERATELSAGRNLMVKVLMAEFYARLTFNQVLHDELLEQVLSADVSEPGLTLINSIAQTRAAQLQESGRDYF